MFLRSLFVIGLMAFSLVARADVLGAYVGVGYWNSSFGGDVVADVDVEDELDISSDNGAQIYAGIEHPIPVLPNIRVARTNIEDSGTGTLSSTFVYQGETFTATQTVATSVDLTHTDLTLYYEIIDIGMDVDVGLTARWLDGEVALDQAQEEVKGVLPMVYVRGKFYLPMSGLYVGGDINAVSYSESSVSDYSLRVGWETESFLFPEFGIEGGYRRFNIDADAEDTDVDVNLDMDGFFINLTAHF
ncbi:MAG: TIGR04219 family outer membrane beta-barrel protein [Pseudomonadales bacterium]|nr:TIGR04219 family outer membrane beta-barrel protein [Pseudomonadales bacterium]